MALVTSRQTPNSSPHNFKPGEVDETPKGFRHSCLFGIQCLGKPSGLRPA